MTTPNTQEPAKNDTPADDQESCASLQGELSDAVLDGVSGGRIINTVITRPSGTGTGGTGGGTTGSGNTTTTVAGISIDVLMTPAAPSPIPIPYPNLKI